MHCYNNAKFGTFYMGHAVYEYQLELPTLCPEKSNHVDIVQ